MEIQLEKTIQIVAFGMIAEVLTSQERSWKWAPDTDALRADLIASFPQLTDLPFVIAVDMEVGHGNQPVSPGATIALLPPYSGG